MDRLRKPTVSEKRRKAAHEIGHALVMRSCKCTVTYIQSMDTEWSSLGPRTGYRRGALDPNSDKLISAAGVGGVMALLAFNFGGRNSVGPFRRYIATAVPSYWWSTRGNLRDLAEFKITHEKEYGHVPSWATFYLYAAEAANIILDSPSLFLRAVDALETWGFISAQNFINLVGEKGFDELENNLSMTEHFFG